MLRRHRKPEFRPDIEGLRAVAVMAVVAFHTGAVTGGFVGVDVFFVISGFLITRLLWAELGQTGRVDLVRFYAARARRLLPAAGVVLVATALAAAAILPALQARDVLDDGLASALYVGNYRFAITGTDYLAHASPSSPSPFQHYWSLGVEEQFYLIWPAVLLGAAALLGRSRGAAVATLTVLGAGSLWLALSWTSTRPPWAFFSLPTRAWELAAGALIALTATAWRRLPPGLAAVAGFGGLGLIGWSCLRFNPQTPYPGTAALVPVAGAVLVVAAGCSAPRRAAGRWLSAPVMRALGRLSYSWYLWHWPILVLAPAALGHPLGWAGRLAAVAASLALAMLTLRYVERPVRYAVGLRRSSGRSLALGSAITAAAVSAALLLPMLVPARVGPGAPATAAFVQPAERSRLVAADPVTVAAAPLRTAVAASADRRQVPADLSPPLDGAAADKPDVFYNGCVRAWLEVGVPTCESGDTSSPTTVALVGDSHAAMWEPALEPVARAQNWRLSTMAKVTCPLQDLPIRSPYLGRDYTECVQWRGEVLQRLAADRPQLVLLGMSRRYGSDFGFTSYSRPWLDALTALVSELRETTGARVLVLGPVPDPHSVVPVCVSGELGEANACAPPRAEAINADGIAAEAAATRRGGGQYADMTDLFCATAICPVIIGSDLVFRDDNHVTTTYARRLQPVLGALAQRSLSPRS